MQVERTVCVRVRDGLHARPATQFVKLAKSFQSDIELVRGEQGVSAKSSVKLMLLGVKENDELIIRASGEDAAVAMDALARFLETPDAGLDVGGASGASAAEKPQPSPQQATAPAASEGAKGIPAGEGTALGPVYPFFHEDLVADRRQIPVERIEEEVLRYEAAVAQTVAALLEGRDRAGLKPDDLQIIDALVDVAHDAELVEQIKNRIRNGDDAVHATVSAGEELARSFEAMSDAYIRARAEDIRGVARNIALTLLGRKDATLADVPDGAIIVAEEISAWDFAKAPISRIGGILCTTGSTTSHVAIMARTHGLPAVLGYGGSLEALRAAKTVAINGSTGEVVLDPSEDVAAAYRERIRKEAEAREQLAAFAHVEPRTRDGKLIEVAANLGSLSEVDAALKAGAMGVGLFRTELLFMERKVLPTEDEQTAIYTELARAFAPRPVIVRTLDVGGDKPVAGIEFPEEENPFLGWRGVRMCLDQPEIFRPQLKALLRAAVVGNIKVMVPMIADISELKAVKALVEECRTELRSQNVPFGEIELGIMMETPAAALTANELATEADFFSIGTNDLTQYVMAADRLNPRLVKLNRADHPAVLKAVDMICQAATKAGIWVGVCGEAAAREDLIPEFVRMGVTELSMSPASIARAKKRIIEL
ncbi:phosphoenolpyruvate--protein phosphotransferase [Microvirga guangxiensis]|uniref:Phosphoenolpyruvate-protein phosphotransferase n=1 Tax=Microvirga guangxiensis TaxID=549386 RepID=A0A1G5E4R3_9HYPH|nr:phosphoenolpyruvate--protein phosphotransferase [Microvirga guangxiensis]SCY21966.1 phosphocarrier protein FPr [Microvirga guangxiensis]